MKDDQDRKTIDIEAHLFGKRFASKIPYAIKIPLNCLRAEWLQEGDLHMLVSKDAPFIKTAGILTIDDRGRICMDAKPKHTGYYAYAVLYPAPRDAEEWETAEWGDEVDTAEAARQSSIDAAYADAGSDEVA